MPGAAPYAHRRVATIFGLVLCALFGVWLAFNRDSLLTDPDTAWHIIVGRDIWTSKTFPTTDHYSHTFDGQPWIAKEWLGQILLATGYAASGWQGVVALSIAAIIALGVAVYACAAQHLKPAFAAVLTIIAMGAARSSFLARPHIFALPLTVIWTYLLFQDASSGRTPRFWLLALLLLWANLHGSFTLGWAIAGIALLQYCETTRLSDRAGLFRWAAFVALCPLVSMIHPYGYKAALMTLAVTGSNEATPLLEEWLPFNPGTQIAALAALLLWLGASIASGVKLSLSKTALCLGLLYLFLAHGRFGSLLFTVAPAVMAQDFARALPAISFENWKRQSLDATEGFLARHFTIACTVVSGALAAGLAIIAYTLPATRQPALAIDGAMQFAKSQHLKGPVMNFYNFGGALIFNDIPTYIDGRSDQLFQNGFFLNDQKTMQANGATAFADTLQRYKIEWTLFPPHDPRNALLDANPDWSKAYADDTAIIHVRAVANGN